MTAIASVVCAVVLGGMAGAPSDADGPTLSKGDRAYLRGVAEETWACIAHFVEPTTGLPYDTSRREEHTSVTNLGYYVASCAVAAEMGIVSREEAVTRVRRVLDAYEKFKKWEGFSQSWNSVRTLEPWPNDTMISVLDSGNMVAGFVVAAQAMPEVREQAERILAAMKWSSFYDKDRGLLFGGYDLKAGRLDRGWHIGDYAGDGRIAAFWAIASSAAPPESWGKLKRKTEDHYGLTIYRPAWMGGGLFMQVQDGLFLDERGTPAGRSAADFAYAQMLYAADLGLDAWGWSACYTPDEQYLGWGGLEVPVVTPHAAGMMAMVYPHKAAECLRRLEAMGARAPFVEDGKRLRFGFRDSVDLDSGRVCELYVPPLDQAMLFFGIANVLNDGVVQRLFESHPTVRRGRELIPEYTRPVDAAWLAELRHRDRDPLVVPTQRAGNGPAHVVIEDSEDENAKVNSLGGAVDTWTRDADDETMSVRVSRDVLKREGKPAACIRVDYDVDSPNPAYGGVSFLLEHANGSGCNAVAMWVRGAPEQIKLELHGRGGIGVTHVTGVKAEDWTRVVIPYVRLGGMITDWSDLERLVLVFEKNVSRPQTGTLWLDDICLTRTD